MAFPGLVTRKQWGARRASYFNRLRKPVYNVFTAFTKNTLPCYDWPKCILDLQFLQDECMYTGRASDILYNFMIGSDGRVYEGRGWTFCPGLPARYSKRRCHSIFIGFLGYFKWGPPDDMLFIVREELLRFGVANNHIRPRFLDFAI